MPRSITSVFRSALELPSTANYGIILATLTGGGLASSIYLASDNSDYQVHSQRYVGVSFEISLLTDNDQPPRAQARVMNVDREVGEALLPLIDSPAITLEVVASSSFNAPDGTNLRTGIGTPTIQYTASGLRIANIRVDAMFVTFDLVMRDYASEPFPGVNASQDRCPGLYR